MNTSLLSSALVFCRSGVAFTGFTGPDHASDAIGVSNETVVNGFAEFSLVAVVHLINIRAARHALKTKAGKALCTLVLIGTRVVLYDAAIGSAAVDQAGLVFWAIGSIDARQALAKDFNLSTTRSKKHETQNWAEKEMQLLCAAHASFLENP